MKNRHNPKAIKPVEGRHTQNNGIRQATASVVTAMCMAACLCAAPKSMAAPAEETVFRTELERYTTLQLPGDETKTMLSANWEAELKNTDGNQNQLSMARCGDQLFLCTSYFDDTDSRKDGLFLRRFSVHDGTDDHMTIPLPEDFKAGVENFHTITSDSKGNLVAALVQGSKYVSSETVTITLYRVDTDNRKIDTDSRIAIEIPAKEIFNSDVDYDPWMERIDCMTGDFVAGEFRFGATIGWRSGTSHYVYSHILFDYDPASSEPFNITDRQTIPVERLTGENNNVWPDITPLSEGTFVVTRAPETNGGPYYAPTIYTRTDGKTDDTLSSPWASNSAMANCRGFYTFTHNGHTLAVTGIRHDTALGGKGSYFRLINLPSDGTFKGETPLWDFPATAFPSDAAAHPVYHKSYRQLAVVEPAADGDAPETHIYICSPGCGIGSYTLSTDTGITTSLTSVDNGPAEAPILQGRTLRIPESSDSPVRVFDLTGRHLAEIPVAGSEADLQTLAAGLYIVQAGNTTMKICLR